MKRLNKLSVFFVLLFLTWSYGHSEYFQYKREIETPSEPWHKIVLPDDVYGKISNTLYDLRIYGITDSKDTIEAPYILRQTTETISSHKISFKTINASYNNDGYYVTFEIPSNEEINQIKLVFKQENFDWSVMLEGSQNQQEWFTILEDYRILSINNALTNYHFTTLNFPFSKYRFFRMAIKSNIKPELTEAFISKYEIINGTERSYPIRQVHSQENKKSRQTEIDLSLQLPVPVSHVKIRVKDEIDYYRPITIKYLVDSFKTEQGWEYNYKTIYSGILNSVEPNEFKMGSEILQKLKIIIQNQDNIALTIDSIEVKGYVNELLVRFSEPATYYLNYRSKNAVKPQYDIERFLDKIPEKLTELDLGQEVIVDSKVVPAVNPLFKNKVWLWVIMGLVIVVLGWFSITMIRKG